MSELLKEYSKWVIDNGHITKYASSVLQEFINEKGYNRTDYKLLANELGF